jgi:hypothetical protein
MSLDFKAATDVLFRALSHEELAKELGVSVPSIRQARLGAGTRAFRKPPEGWQLGVARLAEVEAKRLQRLSKSLQRAFSRAKKAK